MFNRKSTHKTMPENGLYRKTILNNRTGFQSDRVLLLGQLTEGKAHPEFLKFYSASRTIGTFTRHISRHINPNLQKSHNLPTHEGEK